MHTGTLDLTLDQITKIEGHATLGVKIRKGKVSDIKFSIAEFKRFYTQAIRGKVTAAVPQLVARICGTCSNAHLLCSLQAIEDAYDITVSEQTEKLRQLLNHGLMIRDHALHCYVFSLPDVFGRDSILAFDEKNDTEHELLHDALAVKEAGNQLSIWSGGRSVHAPSPTVGGFITLPENGKQEELIQRLQNVRERVLRLIKIFYECPFTLTMDMKYSALFSDTYDYLHGDVIGANGESVKAKEYGDHLEHVVIPYSQASGYKFKGKIYMVGAIARLNLSKEHLHKNTKKDAAIALSAFPSNNVFHNNLAQAIEILHSIDESIDILSSLTIQPEKPNPFAPKKAIGIGVIEAPRGTLYHKYDINEKGIVEKARIIVPTGQNQIAIEKCLWKFTEHNLDKTRDGLSFEYEKIIRAFDPCMSCASHFLKVKMDKK